MRKINMLLSLAGIAITAIMIQSCQPEDFPSPNADTAVPSPGQGKVMVIHADPFLWDSVVRFELDSQALASLNFRAATQYFGTTSLHHVIEGFTPTAIEPQMVAGWAFQKDGAYTVILTSIDSVLGANYSVLTDDLSAPNSGFAKIRYYNAASDLRKFFNGNLIDNGVSVGTSSGFLFQNKAFRDFSAFIEVPAGNYSFEVNSDSTFAQIDSLVNVNLQDGKIYTILTSGMFSGQPAGLQTNLITHN